MKVGVVYKMYTLARENTLQEYMAPEMIRSRLENVILKIKVLGYDAMEDLKKNAAVGFWR